MTNKHLCAHCFHAETKDCPFSYHDATVCKAFSPDKPKDIVAAANELTPEFMEAHGPYAFELVQQLQRLAHLNPRSNAQHSRSNAA